MNKSLNIEFEYQVEVSPSGRRGHLDYVGSNGRLEFDLANLWPNQNLVG